MFIINIIMPSWDRNNFPFLFKNSLTEDNSQTVNLLTLKICNSVNIHNVWQSFDDYLIKTLDISISYCQRHPHTHFVAF